MNFRCESQDELEQINKSTSQNSFEKNNLYPWTVKMKWYSMHLYFSAT